MKYFSFSIIFSIIFAFIFVASVHAADVTTGLMGYWTFDEGTGSTVGDSSGNGYGGTFRGNPVWTTGKIGKALDFDGDLDAVALSDILTPQQYTVAFWMLTGTGGNAAIDRVVVGKNSSEYELRINAPNSSLSSVRGVLTARTNTKTLEYPAINFYDSDHIGLWHHIAYTVDTVNGIHTLYINGVKALSAATMLTPVDTVTPLWIGANPQGKDEYFIGAVDEVRFYDRVLTADDVAALYKLTTASIVASSVPAPEVPPPSAMPALTPTSTPVPGPSYSGPIISGPQLTPIPTSPSVFVPLPATPPPIPPATPSQDILYSAAHPASRRTSSEYRFTRDLTIGSFGEDVRQLQIFLNDWGFFVVETGAGSLAHESSFFGQRTKAALARYQEFHAPAVLTPVSLTRGTGYFGPRTREKVHQDLSEPPLSMGSSLPLPGTENKESIQQQIDSLLQQVRLLQAMIEDRR